MLILRFFRFFFRCYDTFFSCLLRCHAAMMLTLMSLMLLIPYRFVIAAIMLLLSLRRFIDYRQSPRLAWHTAMLTLISSRYFSPPAYAYAADAVATFSIRYFAMRR